jgi:hypothetical protein
MLAHARRSRESGNNANGIVPPMLSVPLDGFTSRGPIKFSMGSRFRGNDVHVLAVLARPSAHHP